MSRYKLLAPESNIPYSKIVQGRKWVGRVYPKADGTFGAVLGKGEHVSAPTRVEAFELVVAKFCGFSSAQALKSSNAQVRAANRVKRENARAMADQFLHGSLEDQIALLDKLFGTNK